MEISPWYDGAPIVVLDGAPDGIAVPTVRQRRRLLGTLRALSPEEWESPSRCEGWRVQDVVAHLVTVDRFWAASVNAGLSGEPTRFLVGFDPKATPAALVDSVRETSSVDTLAEFADATEAFCALVESIDEAGWSALAESPMGHVSMSALAHHALWDAWIHERDVLLPLGMQQEQHDDEVLASLRYAAALSPAFAVQNGTALAGGALALTATDPDARVVVTVGDQVTVTDGDAPAGALELTGDAVQLIETLSVRLPWRQAIPDDKAWLLAGLTDVFETTATSS